MKKNDEWNTLLNSIFKEPKKQKVIPHVLHDLYKTWIAKDTISNTPLHRKQENKR